MGVYKHEQASFEGRILQEEYDNIKSNKLIQPCEEDDLIEASLNAVADVEENYQMIMKSVALHEANFLIDEEQSYVYTEANITDFVHAVKRFLLRIWDKIVAMYKHFIMFMDRMTMGDKAFVNKYRKQIFAGKDLSDFSFYGYKYTIDEGEIKNAIDALKASPGLGNYQAGAWKAADAGKTDGVSTDASTQAEAKFNDQIETLRGLVISKFVKGKGKAGKYSNGEFLKELHHCLRAGQEEKEELDQTQLNVNGIVEELMTSNDAKKKAKTAFREGKRSIDEAIKTVEQLQKDKWHEPNVKNPEQIGTGERGKGMGKGGKDRTNKELRDDSMRQIGYYLNYTRTSRSILITLEGSILNALRERSKQYKLCLVKIIHHEPSKKEDADITESAQYTFQTEDYISDIKLI